MRCRNFVDGEVVWFGSKGIKSQDTQYQEIDITNGGNIEGQTITNQRFKIKGTTQKEWFINFFDEYGIKKYVISTKELPLRELPSLSYNPNYTFSWDKTLAQVNSMTNGGNVKCRTIATTNITTLIPIDNGYNGDVEISIKNLESSNIHCTISYPTESGTESHTYLVETSQTQYFTLPTAQRFHESITIEPNGDCEILVFNNQSIKEIQYGNNANNLSSGNDSIIEKVIIPEYSTSLNSGAFYNCLNLKAINLPNSITSIGDYCFRNSSIQSFVFGDNIQSCGDYIFLGCNKLVNVILGDSMQEIGWEMFKDCTSLKYVHIPDSVQMIYSYAFMNCTSLEEIVIPDSVTDINVWGLFYGCTNLKKITTPLANAYPFGSNHDIIHFGSYFYYDDAPQELEGCTRVDVEDSYVLIPNTLSDVTITIGSWDGDNTITNTIESNMFEGMTMLKSIGIGESITLIKNNAFLNCTDLTFVVIDNIPSGITIEANAFDGCDNLLRLFYGDIEQTDVVLISETGPIAYIQVDGEYSGVLTSPIVSIAIYNKLYDNVILYLYPKTQKDSAENFVGEQSGVASALNQLLNIIRGELWFATNTGLPLFDKVSSKIQMDATVLQIVNSQEDVIAIKSFESYIQGHSYSCKIEIVSKYGDLTISI